MIREIQSGKVVERSCFPVGNATKPRKGKKKGSTTVRKQDQNDKDAARRLSRVLNCNYGPGDIFLSLTYSPARFEKIIMNIKKDGRDATPDTIREYAIHERDKFLRRVKRDLKKTGVELKYIAATSDIDGSTGELVRIHHHMVVQKAAFDFIFKQWSKEEVNYKPLRDQDDYTPIAEYILKQVRRQPDEKKYTASRNMKKPEIKEKLVLVRKELTAPKNAKVMYRGEYDRETAFQYVRYIAPEKKQKRGGKRE